MRVPREGGPIRGDLLKWARQQRGLTMRQVDDAGGPSIGYQCDVENGKKREVHTDTLEDWLQILGVPEAFVRGSYLSYHSSPTEARGQFSHLADRLLTLLATPQSVLPREERPRSSLRLLADYTNKLVLAYALGLELDALDAMLGGTLDIPKAQVEAIAGLTLLDPDDILLERVSDRMVINAYGPVMRMAFAKGIPMETIRQLLEELP